MERDRAKSVCEPPALLTVTKADAAAAAVFSSPLLEPTTTLVLSSPSGRFVDIRLLRPGSAAKSLLHGALLQDVVSDLEAQSLDGESTLPHVDWAFAGTSSRVVTQPAAGAGAAGAAPGADAAAALAEEVGEVSQAQWAHWVDSRHADASSVVDRGECRTFCDAVQRRVLEEELGSMINPATGLQQPYREVWAVPDADDALVASSLRDGRHRLCVVLEVDVPQSFLRGVVIRLGAWMQGVLRHRDAVSVVRLQLTEAGWAARAKLGPETHLFAPACHGCAAGDGLEEDLSLVFPQPSSLAPDGLPASTESDGQRQSVQWTLVERYGWD